jgi:hypothetical protein
MHVIFIMTTVLWHGWNLAMTTCKELDYVYTLQGWLKGVNATNLSGAIDPGKDALPTSLNASFAKDVYSFGLTYYG